MPPKPAPHETLGRQINLTARATRALLDARLADLGASFADWAVLSTLHHRGTLIQRDLARLIEVEGPTLVRRLDQMESAGLVQRSPHPTDRRATQVTATAQGEQAYERLWKAVRATEVELQEGLDPADLETTRATLKLLSARARELRQR